MCRFAIKGHGSFVSGQALYRDPSLQGSSETTDTGEENDQITC